MNELLHIDIFSGIGGFSLAFEAAGFETVCFCENDPDRQRDLRYHWPDVPIISDINDTDAICRVVADAAESSRCEKQSPHAIETGQANERSVGSWKLERGSAGCCEASRGTMRARQGPEVHKFYARRALGERSGHATLILTAGVPCQPASSAGKRKASADDRWLWPQTIRLVDRLRPDYLVFENPVGIASLSEPAAIPGVVIERLRDVPGRTVCEILTAIRLRGYEFPTDRDGVPWIPCVPAAGVGAFHERARLWIVARYRTVDYTTTSRRTGSNGASEQEQGPGQRRIEPCIALDKSNGEGLPQSGQGDSRCSEQSQGQRVDSTPRSPSTLPDWSNAILQLGHDQTWRAVKPGLHLLASRVPRRTSKLRGFGNSICPQVAFQIAKAIRETITQ